MSTTRITNVRPVPDQPEPTTITDASVIRAALEAAGIQIGTHPDWGDGYPKRWAATVQVGEEIWEVRGFDERCTRMLPGTLSAGRDLGVRGGALVEI